MKKTLLTLAALAATICTMNAHAEPMKIYGLTLDQPLGIAECPISEKDAKYNMGEYIQNVGSTCTIRSQAQATMLLDDIKSTVVIIAFPDEVKPVGILGNASLAYTDEEGNLLMLESATGGKLDQADIYTALEKNFGQPNYHKVSDGKDGVAQGGITAQWKKDNGTVEFIGALKVDNMGKLLIYSPRIKTPLAMIVKGK